jgi:hypothetical protein
MPYCAALSAEDFDEMLHELTSHLIEDESSRPGPFVRLVVRAGDTFRYCDFDLHLQKDCEHDYAHQLHAFGRFVYDRQMPVAAVFVVGGGLFQPIGQDRHIDYPALLVSGESTEGLRGWAHAMRAADGGLTSFQHGPATTEESTPDGQVARFVYEGIRARGAALRRLDQQRN